MKTKRDLIPISLLCCALLQTLTSEAQPVAKIAAGGGHSLFLKSNGSLWAIGGDFYGQLGDAIFGPFHNVTSLEMIVTDNVTEIAGGYQHSLLVKNNGSLWAMGRNLYGQLGDGTLNDADLPKLIVVSNVTAISAGGSHSLFLKGDGSLWAMGYNNSGQLGNRIYFTNSFKIISPAGAIKPENVASNVIAIAAGYEHSLFLRSDGSLWAMGEDSFGVLGDGTTNGFDYYTNCPEQIVVSNVTAIAAGDNFSLFLKSDGSLWAMGLNTYGQLGDGACGRGAMTNRPEQIVASNVTAIAAGYEHSLFLKSDGSLWGMGMNSFGELGDGTYITNAPFGINLPELVVSSNVAAIAAGESYSLFLKDDGSLWAMGCVFTLSSYTNRPVQIIINPNYNQICCQLTGRTDVKLSFLGIADAHYALDHASSLSLPNWIPQATNAAEYSGVTVFTNTPDSTANNFWRIRSVP